MQFFVAFITILGTLPLLVRWAMEGKISVGTASILALLMVFLLSLGRRAYRIVGPVLALSAFGLQYASQGTLRSFLQPILALLPLGGVLFGVFIMFRGFTGGGRER